MSSFSSPGALLGSVGFSCCQVNGVLLNRVAADTFGNAFVETNVQTGNYDFGGGSRPFGEYLIKYDAAFNYQWDIVIPNNSAAAMRGDGAGNLFVTSLSPGGFGACATSADTIVLSKLNPAGSCLWAKTFGGGLDKPNLTIGPNGNVHLAGQLKGTASLGGNTLSSGNGETIALAKLSNTGAHMWSVSLGNSNNNASNSLKHLQISTKNASDVIVAAMFNGSVDVGVGKWQSSNGWDAVVLKIDATNGAVLNQFHITAPGSKIAVASTSLGDAIVSSDNPMIDLGCGPLKPMQSTGVVLGSLPL